MSVGSPVSSASEQIVYLYAVSKHKRHSRDVVLIKEVSQQNLTIWANLANNTHGLGLLLYHHILQHSSGLSLPQKTNRKTNKKNQQKKLEIKSPEIFIVAVSVSAFRLYLICFFFVGERNCPKARGEQMSESVRRARRDGAKRVRAEPAEKSTTFYAHIRKFCSTNATHCLVLSLFLFSSFLLFLPFFGH